MSGVQQRTDHDVFGIAEALVVETHAQGQVAEDFYVGAGFAGGVERRARQLQIVVAVGAVEIGVFQERGRGQQDVGVIGGVGLELFQHHGEQIFAAHPCQHLRLIRGDGRGVGVVDHHRLDGRVVQFRERLAELRHVDDARFASERERCCSSGISSAALLNWNACEVVSCRPPPTSFHDPVSAGRAAMARTAAPPRSLRWTP